MQCGLGVASAAAERARFTHCRVFIRYTGVESASAPYGEALVLARAALLQRMCDYITSVARV